MPISVSGFERLNDREVDFEDTIKIRTDEYRLRSVVLAEVNRNSVEKNVVVGSSAIFMIHADHSKGQLQNEWFQYDPISVADAVEVNGKLENRRPVSQLYGAQGVGVPGTSFTEMARERGIIFMYENAKKDAEAEVMY
jgi:hypothetical protein